MRWFARWIAIAVLGLAPCHNGAVLAADDVHKVLMLHAYHHGLAWSEGITQGVHSVLGPFARRIELYVEYLDLLRYPGDSYLMQQEALYRLKIGQQGFDVVIVADDEAFDFIRGRNVLPAAGPPVVFCGVSRFEPEMIAPGQPVTGVVEQLEHQATLELMFKLQPDCRRIVALYDTRPADSLGDERLRKALADMHGRVTVEHWQDVAFEELPARLQGLGPDDLIYLLALNRDKQLPYIYSDEGVRLVARWSPVAIYSPLEVYLGKGITGGKITSGFDQGEQAAQMVLRLLSGEAAQAVPVMRASPNRYAFDHEQLRRWKIETANLPPDSRLVNQPPPLLTRISHYAYLVMAGLGALVLILLFALTRLAKKTRQLVTLKTEQDERLREKIAQLQMIQQKLKKQSLSDDVTGIANRRHMVQRLGEEIKKAQRYGMPLSIVMLDIDRFKQINDEFGYAVGDKVLRDVGQVIKRSVRDVDIVGRFSAEVFLVILPNTDRTMAFNIAERSRLAVAALTWEQGQVRVAISGGLASLSDQPAGELTKVAKFQLARAKFESGNRIAPSPEQMAATEKTRSEAPAAAGSDAGSEG